MTTAMLVTLLFTALLVIVAMLITGLVVSRPNGNILLGVSLPNHALEDGEVKDIVKAYTRAYLWSTILCTVLVVPIAFVGEDIAVFYFLLWCLLAFFLLLRVSEQHFTRLYDIKVANEWWVGEQHIIAVDTAVSRLKHTFMVSPRWFFLPLAVSGALLVVDVVQGVTPFWPLMGLGTLAMFYVLHLAIGRVRIKTYSEDSSVNLQLNYLFKREWSRCMIILAVVSCIFYVVAPIAAEAYRDVPMLVATFALCIAGLVVIVLAHVRVKTWRNKLLHPTQKLINRDDDRFWIGGIFYSNPDDSSIIVEKRLGIGFTMNIGILPGKLILIGVVLFVIAAIVLPFWLI